MDTSQYVEASFVIIGLVNGIQLAVNREWKSFSFFMTAVVAGVVFGILNWFGLNSPEVGLMVAIASSGVYKLTQNIKR